MKHDGTHPGRGRNAGQTPCCTSGRGPGRPPEMDEAERRERILCAASTILQKSGYHAASMDQIARCSGMSKRTLYQLFPSRHDLFLSLISSRLFHMPLPQDTRAETAEEKLLAFQLAMARWLVRPEQIRLIRVLIAEAPDNPDITDIIRTLLTSCCDTSNLMTHLKNFCAEAGHPQEDVVTLARHLFGSTVGELLLKSLMYVHEYVAEEAMQQFVISGTRLFLAGLRAEWAQNGDAPAPGPGHAPAPQ